MNCYGLGDSLYIDPDSGLLEVQVADGGGLEIIDGEGLSLKEPQKAPIWTTWTPTLTGMTQGDGTVTARYFNQGGLVMFSFTFTLGSTSAMGSDPAFSAPEPISDWGINGSDARMNFGMVSIEDNGTSNYQGLCFNTVPSSNIIYCRAFLQTGVYTVLTTVTSTVPHTWASGDTLQARGWYKSAV